MVAPPTLHISEYVIGRGFAVARCGTAAYYICVGEPEKEGDWDEDSDNV